MNLSSEARDPSVLCPHCSSPGCNNGKFTLQLQEMKEFFTVVICILVILVNTFTK